MTFEKISLLYNIYVKLINKDEITHKKTNFMILENNEKKLENVKVNVVGHITFIE